jgi:hypothetical protein
MHLTVMFTTLFMIIVQDVANLTAKSDRCDLLQFLHSIEEVVAMEKQNEKFNF